VCKFRLLFGVNKCIDAINYIDLAYFPQLILICFVCYLVIYH
jgi:hypothetical protein